MKENRIALVFQGGGMRCAFSQGVIDALAPMLRMPDVKITAIVATSGSVPSAAYCATGQNDVSREVWLKFAPGRMFSWWNLFAGRPILRLDRLEHAIANTHPLDLVRLRGLPFPVLVTATRVKDGKSVVFDLRAPEVNPIEAMMASMALPGVHPSVLMRGDRWFDGSISDPIPFPRAIQIGATQVVVVLTRPRGFQKPNRPRRFAPLWRWLLRENPAVARAALAQADLENERMRELAQLEKEGRCIVIAPEKDLDVSRYERDPDKIARAVNEGHLAANRFSQVIFADPRRRETIEISPIRRK